MNNRPASLLAALALIAFVSLGLPDGVLGVAWPSVRRTFGLPLSHLGLLLSATVGGYLVSSFFSGQTVRAIGVGWLLVASSILVTIGLLGTAITPLWGGMIFCGLLGGLGAGAIDAGINSFAAERFSPRWVTWLHACYGVGATAGPLLMTAMVTSRAGWRSGYAALAMVLGAMSLLFFLTRRLWTSSTEQGQSPQAGEDGPAAGIFETLRRPVVWAHIVLFFLYTGIEVTAGQWLFSLLTESRGVNPGLAGAVVGLYWAALTVGRIFFGQLATRFSRKSILRFGATLAPLAAGLIAWRPWPGADLGGACLLGFALAPIFPMLISATPDRVGRRFAAQSIGFQVSAANAGVAALPGLAGVLARHYGLEVLGPYLLATTIALVLLHEAALRLAFHHRSQPEPAAVAL